LEEGVKILYSWGPKKLYGDSGKVSGAELVRCTSVFDDAGNFCPFFDDTVMTVEADQVILAVGQSRETEFCKDFCFLEESDSLPVKNGLILIDKETQETEMPGVFAGGDAANGPGTVIEAIAAGRRAAASIDRFLGGDGILPKFGAQTPMPEYTGKREKGFSDLRRAEMPAISVSERHDSFAEVELGFDEELAKAEAQRCLQCDLELKLAKSFFK
jgi:NADPH-dependent glutamate synthase beta subunit-like oxidoreductase